MGAIEQIRIHVFVITGCVVAHAVGDHSGMILGNANEEFRVPRISICPVGAFSFPVVMAEVWLRERDEHPDIVGRPQDLRKADIESQVRSRSCACKQN